MSCLALFVLSCLFAFCLLAVCLLAFRFACLPATPRLVLSWLPHVLSFFIVWVCWLLILSSLVFRYFLGVLAAYLVFSCLVFCFLECFLQQPPLPLTVPTAASYGFAVCLLSFLCVCLPAKPRLVLSWLPLVLSCFVVCLCWLLVLSSPTLNLKPNP